ATLMGMQPLIASLWDTFEEIALRAGDPIPRDEDVVAGAWGAITFVGLLIAVALLGFSLSRHLRKAGEAKDQGAFGDGMAVDDGVPDQARDSRGSD
ncbi:MAG: hypothetical protein ACRCYX_06945, partial [Dermatophilaceae bacterium]